MKTAIRCAVYARVSTSDQNCALQLRELHEYVHRRAWTCVEEYIDQGVSGAKASRPELDRLMKAAKQDTRSRKFDAVLVYKLDRFGRSVRYCLEGIETLRMLGIRFLAITQ